MDAVFRGFEMSIEYAVHIDDPEQECRDRIFNEMKRDLPNWNLSDDGNALWLASTDPKWIDASIEKTEDGFLIVDNLGKNKMHDIFSKIEKMLHEFNIQYKIEEP